MKKIVFLFTLATLFVGLSAMKFQQEAEFKFDKEMTKIKTLFL